MLVSRSFVASCALAALLVIARPTATRACAIDNVASLSANGVPAMLAGDRPAAGGAWAPFVLAQAFAPNTPVRLEEARADLARTLPATVRTATFRWDFGDGTMALGHEAVHRYARPGRYHLLVYGYYGRERRWLGFDSAMVRVVPASQLLQANMWYEALRAVITLSGVTWPLDALLVCIAATLLLRHPRHQAAAPRAAAGRRGSLERIQ